MEKDGEAQLEDEVEFVEWFVGILGRLVMIVER
jgi:hypothetical protein